MSKKCLDCKSTIIDDLEADMENEVPLWYKKAGNYSLLPKLLNREDKFNPNKTDLEEGLTKMWNWTKKQPERNQFIWPSFEVNKKLYSFWKNTNDR